MMNTNSHIADLITELISIGAGKAADSMNKLLGSHIKLTIPWVDFFDNGSMRANSIIAHEMIGVQMNFRGKPDGYAQMFFKENDVPSLINGLLGFNSGCDLEDESLNNSALNELGNIVINAIVGSICNMIGTQVVYDIPFLIREIPGCPAIADVNYKVIVRAGTTFTFQRFNIAAMLLLFIKDGCFLNTLQDFFNDNSGKT